MTKQTALRKEVKEKEMVRRVVSTFIDDLRFIQSGKATLEDGINNWLNKYEKLNAEIHNYYQNIRFKDE